MKRKKILALALTAAALLPLCACGGTYVEAYDTAEGAASEALDFDAAWAKYDPDYVVCTVDGEDVTWREFFYQIKYFKELAAATDGTTITSWDQTSAAYTDEDGSPVTYGALVLQNAVNTIVQYHAVHKNLTDAGAVLGKDALDAVENMRQSAIDENFDGDEEAFAEYLESMYCTEELWSWYNQVDALYAYDGFETLYGPFGSRLSDADVTAYAGGDPDGSWTQYVQIKQIYLYSDETDEESGDEEGAVDARAVDILAALDAAADPSAAFDELYAEYNEENALDVYNEGGRSVYEGDVDDAVYQAALELEEYEYAAVSIDGGTAVVMRVPIEPDSGVYYDESSGTMYTLRYYAAWQSYSDLINGEDGWIASAERAWAEDFGSLTLQELFS